MIIAFIYNDFFFHLGMRHIFYQCPTDTATTSGINKSILRTGIKCIFPLNELRMQHNITLLALCFQIRKAFPVLQVLGTGDTGCSRCRRQISCRSIIVRSFGTEYTIYPTVLMSGKAHIINVRCRNNIFRHRHRIIPKTEIIYSVRTLCNGKERFTVSTFHAYHQQILSVPFDGTGIHGCIHADTLHQIRIRLLIQIITPEYRRMGSSQHRMFITGNNTISTFHRIVFAGEEFLMFGQQGSNFVFK